MLDNKKTCDLPQEDREMIRKLGLKAARMNRRLIEMHRRAEELAEIERMERAMRRLRNFQSICS